MLLDQFGNEIKSVPAKPDVRPIAAVSIKDRYSSYPSSGLTPEKLAAILKEADSGLVSRQAELFEEMEEKDAHLASQFQTRKLAVQGLDWELIPGDETPKAAEIATFCRSVLESLSSWDDNQLDMLDAISKGYSCHEIIWDVSTGQAIINGLKWIHPKRISFKDSMTPRIVVNPDIPSELTDMEWYRFVYHRYKARSGYDTKAGVMRVCAWMYLFKNYAIKDWAAFAEIFGVPLRLGKYDPSATKEDKAALLTAVTAIGTDAAGIISKNTEIEFKEVARQGSVDLYQRFAEFCDIQMSRAVLGQTLTSSSGDGSGSFALGKVHSTVRQDILEADCKSLSKTITQQILRPLVIFNFGEEAPCPKHKFNYEPPEDLKSASEIYRSLIDFGYPISQEHIEKRFNIPRIQEGETPLAPPRAASPFSVSGGPDNLLSGRRQAQDALSASALSAPDGDKSDSPLQSPPDTAKVLNTLDGMAAEEAPVAMSDVTAQVSRLLDECESLEEFRDKVMSLSGSLVLDKFEDLIKKAMTLANLTGRFNARR